MKNKLSQIFNNKNTKIIIPVIMLIVLLIVVFIYLREYKYNRYRDKQDKSFYQYYAGQKIEYEATVSFNKDKEIKGFSPKVIKIEYDSTPIYYKDEKKIIFPSEMSIIFPLKKQLEAKTKEFSYIERVNNINYLTFEDYHGNIDHYIMFDGKNLYLFSDSVTFTLNNEEVTLSPLSYVVVKRNEFIYYDYEKDEYNKVDISDEVIINNEYYKLNATHDYLEHGNDKLLLTNDLGFVSILEED